MFAVTTAASAVFAAEPSAADYQKQLDEVRLMRAKLAESNLSSFMDVAEANRWTAPYIHSASWVAWLPAIPVEQVLLEQENRKLGRDLLTRIDCEAFRILAPADNEIRKSQIDLLLRFSSWIRKERGYGNFALMMRAENLAYIPIGHLAVNLGCPLEDVESFMARLTPLRERLEFQVDILNKESPHAFTVPSIENWEDGLEIQWQKRLAPA